MVDSPCIQVCVIEDGRCIGCGRTRSQIARWMDMDDEERRKVLEEIKDQT